MAELPRLNNVIKALESGKPAFTSFCNADPETAIAMTTAKYDGVVYEMEHNPWDGRALRDSLQYMLNRAQIVNAGSVAPAVTPMVRVPVNGIEKCQWHAKQALDIGCYGIVWPHISTVEEAYNAVAACRYPRLKTAKNYEPAGIRGDGPTSAVRYWGLTQQEYYDKADVWPLDPVTLIFGQVGMNAKAPHPNAARLAANFMLSQECQEFLARFGRLPTRKDVTANPPGIIERLTQKKEITVLMGPDEERQWQRRFDQLLKGR